MSEKKKVIYVKDLVIKADNVRIEPTRRHDPFFGPHAVEAEDEELLEKETVEDVEDEQDDDDKDKDVRPPFSWL